MVTLAFFLLAAFLDPVQAALVLAVVIVYRGPLPILVAAVVAAAVSETVIMLATFDYAWGELIAPRLVASLMQAALLWWVVTLIRFSRAGGDATSRPQRVAGIVVAALTAALRSLAAGSQAQRPSPWHMRACVRRRLVKLRSR